MDWGLPDYLDQASYGESVDWTRSRWRWEFLRRRDDVRAAFTEAANATYDYNQRFVGKSFFPTAGRTPDEVGFTAMHPLALEIGLPRIPNPRIGEQPFDVLSFRDWDDAIVSIPAEHEPEGYLRADIDLSKPIEPQLETLRDWAKDLQASKLGKVLQKRRHPAKWLTYLRILDGREAGASWAELSCLLPLKNRTPQAARDTWNQADALRFKF